LLDTCSLESWPEVFSHKENKWISKLTTRVIYVIDVNIEEGALDNPGKCESKKRPFSYVVAADTEGEPSLVIVLIGYLIVLTVSGVLMDVTFRYANQPNKSCARKR